MAVKIRLSYLASLSLSFLICETGIIKPNPEDHHKRQRQDHVERHWAPGSKLSMDVFPLAFLSLSWHWGPARNSRAQEACSPSGSCPDSPHSLASSLGAASPTPSLPCLVPSPGSLCIPVGPAAFPEAAQTPQGGWGAQGTRLLIGTHRMHRCWARTETPPAGPRVHGERSPLGRPPGACPAPRTFRDPTPAAWRPSGRAVTHQRLPASGCLSARQSLNTDVQGNKSGCFLAHWPVSILGVWEGDEGRPLRAHPRISRDLRPGNGLHYITAQLKVGLGRGGRGDCKKESSEGLKAQAALK